MAIEINPLLSLLSRMSEARRRQQQEAAQQVPASPEMPEWSRRLNPDDFTGQTREMLIQAQSASPGTANQMGKGDLEFPSPVAPKGDRLDMPPLPTGAPGGFSGGYGAANGLVPPVQPGEGQSAPVEPEQQTPASAASPAPQDINLRKELGPHVGGQGGSYIDMVRQYRQTGELPGGGGGDRPPAQVAAAAASPAGSGPGQQSQPSQLRPQSLPPQMQPTSAGGGLFSGSGVGFGDVLGGIGAMLKSAGGDSGAVDKYLERRQARQAQAQELGRFNKTVDSALRMGIDPDYVMTMAETGDMKSLVSAIQEERKFTRDLDKPTDEMREYALYKEQGGDLPFFEFKRELKQAGANKTVGTPQAGYRYEYDAQGNPVQATPIPGSPAAMEAEAAKQQATMRDQQKDRYNDIVISNLDTTINRLTNSNMPLAGVASLAANIPGTPQRDLAANLATIKANIGFDRLQEMREMSPTGGALGQVSNLENQLLQATRGNLEQSQSREQLLNNAVMLRNQYLDTIHGKPEQIAELVRQGLVSPEDGAKLSERQPLPFDDFGNPRGAEPVTVTSPAEAENLPPGTRYRTPDGREYER
jgi:hypothetical protein